MDVLLVDGPLRGQVVPRPKSSGSVAYNDPASGQVRLYVIHQYSLFGRGLFIGIAGSDPESPAVRDAMWEFLVSDLAKALASTAEAPGASDESKPESIRYVRAAATAGGEGRQI